MASSRKKNIRIKDIAKMAGVSEGTVDRVIHDRGSVSPQIEKRIRCILDETGYTPNPIGRSLGTTKDYRIAVMIPKPEQDEYWESAQKGVDRAREEWKSYNLHINLFSFDLYDPDSFSEVSEQVLQSKPDAICSVPMFFEESLVFYKKLDESKIPFIVFNTQVTEQLNEHAPFCFIGPDLYQSGRVAAELMDIMLSKPGKVAIMHIHENIESSVHLKQKELGFKDYFDEKNSKLDISSHSFLRTDESFLAQISQTIADSAYEGIFVSTSSPTSIAAKALEKYNKEHIVLVGFDLLKENIHYLRTGAVNFLINQNPQYQTLQGLRYLVNYLLFNEDIPSVHQMPIQIITKENYKSFLNQTDGGSVSK
jgi:LacI family transcriptional regulator